MIKNNEKEWVASFLATHEKPQKMTLYQLIRYIAMYHYDDWHELKLSQYTNNVLVVMKEFNFDFIEYQEWRFVKYTRNFCKKLVEERARHDLLDIKSVSITKKEIDIIKKAETEKQQQLMFTMYVLAKINLVPSGWVNYNLKEVFECADLKMTKQKCHRFIHDLYKQGLIQLNEYPDRRGYKVELQNDVDDIAITISSFDHIGRQYLNKYKDGWMMCKRCGKMIKIKAPNQKYCKKCGEYIKAEEDKRRRKMEYKLQKLSNSVNAPQPA